MDKFQPSPAHVLLYLERWNSLESYVLQESSLQKLFTQTYPQNTDMDDVLIKVCALNDFYSTNIYSPFAVAKHIVTLGIDHRLAVKDLNLVNDIARVKINEHKLINFYSFATKYCSHHLQNTYPIYDNFVEKTLLHFKRVDKFSIFKKQDLKHYPTYCKILKEFMHFYKLDNFTVKEIDKYLWQAGKDYFPKNYSKKNLK